MTCTMKDNDLDLEWNPDLDVTREYQTIRFEKTNQKHTKAYTLSSLNLRQELWWNVWPVYAFSTLQRHTTKHEN